MAKHESTFVLRECKRCGYAACCCLALRHADGCPWRAARLDTSPKLCPHEQIACEECFPCSCGKPTRWPVKATKVEAA